VKIIGVYFFKTPGGSMDPFFSGYMDPFFSYRTEFRLVVYQNEQLYHRSIPYEILQEIRGWSKNETNDFFQLQDFKLMSEQDIHIADEQMPEKMQQFIREKKINQIFE
jgi:hypothetical protein